MNYRKILSVLLAGGIVANMAVLPANAWESNLKGDVNQDGVFDTADIISLQQWLSSAPETTLPNWKNADFLEDEQLNIVDLALMKKELLQNGTKFTYQAVTDLISNPISWTNEQVNTPAVIRSVTELQDYLSLFLEIDTIQHYLGIYNEEYFQESVLCVNTLYQWGEMRPPRASRECGLSGRPIENLGETKQSRFQNFHHVHAVGASLHSQTCRPKFTHFMGMHG